MSRIQINLYNDMFYLRTWEYRVESVCQLTHIESALVKNK